MAKRKAPRKGAGSTPAKAAKAREPRQPRQPGRLEAEACAVGLFALAAFLWVALFSYSPADPWWGFGETVRNRCGPVGAFVARGLAGSLGYAAHILPLACVVAATRYLGGLPVRPRWVPTLAWSLFALALAAGFEVISRLWPSALRAGGGGALGGAVVDLLSGGLYLAGSAMVVGVAVVLSLLVATGVSVRDAGSVSQRLGRSASRRVASFATVNAARLKRRMQQAAEARPDPDELAPESPALLERLPKLLRDSKPAAVEPEVVEHKVKLEPAPRQQALPFADTGRRGPFKLPGLDMLAQGAEDDAGVDRDFLIKNSQVLEKKLKDFGVNGRVVKVHPGPVITMYEYEPASGVKVSRIVNLADDLALALRAMSVRIVAPIPGKSVVGIEVPNTAREIVVLRDLLSHSTYQDAESKLTIAMGKDIFGTPVVADLAKMPHLLVAGATGSGKSVFLNSLLCSIFFRADPDEVKLLLVDPKMLEFSLFKNIPHLISEVVTNPKRASAALLGVVGKMEERYELMAARGVRNISQYNKAVAKDAAQGVTIEGETPKALPYIVVVIDELADLMIVAARDVEESLMRLAQMARAAGIHLVLATQRPSVDVLTGVIKANFPSRVAFQVSSRTDSRTVLDGNGAERLLGQGDFLYLPPGVARLERLHAPYVSEKEVGAVADYLREQGTPELDPGIIRLKEESEKREERGEDFDELFDSAVDTVARFRIASISFVQRKLKIGYNRAARIVEQMEAEGIVGPQEGTKARDIYVRPPDEEA